MSVYYWFKILKKKIECKVRFFLKFGRLLKFVKVKMLYRLLFVGCDYYLKMERKVVLIK